MRIKRGPPVRQPIHKRHGFAAAPFPQVGSIEDPHSFTKRVLQYLQALEVLGYSESTIKHRRRHLIVFLRWCAERSLARPNEVTLPILERYQRYLFYKRDIKGRASGLASQAQHLHTVRMLFRWLVRQHYMLSNPASELQLPKRGKRLPMDYLSSEEVERVIAQTDITKELGVRDRAILEVFYATGIRRAELAALDIGDVDFGRELLRVRQGKGSRDRVVPISKRALLWVQKYIYEVRPRYQWDNELQALFLSYEGKRVGTEYLSEVVKVYLEAAGINKKGVCHLFRHTMATLMLENGADIRYIQAMLGHADLTTTQIYTQVSITKLKEIYQATHPGEHVHKQKENTKIPNEQNET